MSNQSGQPTKIKYLCNGEKTYIFIDNVLMGYLDTREAFRDLNGVIVRSLINNNIVETEMTLKHEQLS